MRSWKLLFLGLLSRLTYRAYGYFKRAEAGPRFRPENSLVDALPRKHWATGGKVTLIDDSSFTRNIQRIARPSFGGHANRICIANLIAEKNELGKNVVSVFIDRLRVGSLTARDALSFHVVLQESGLLFAVTSCNAHIGGGGTGHEGKKLPYSITLDINWFET